MAEQPKTDLKSNSDIKINPTWKKVYEQILNSPKDSFPSNFWENKIEEKATQLLSYYTKKNKITPRSISYRDPEKIVKDANLEEPVKLAYSDQPELLIVRTFSRVKLDSFQWDNSREPMPKDIEKFRNNYCTWNQIGNHYGVRPEKVKQIVNENNLETPEKGKNSFINSPVLEVELFWNLVNKLQNGNLTLEQMLEIMNKETNWEERRTNEYLCQYNIKEDIGRLKSQKRTKKSLNKVKENLNSTEKLFTEKTNKELKRLGSYGADFIDDENNVIEVKKSLHKYNIKSALLQLIYAKDTLTKVEELKIYTRNYEISKENLSGVKRILSFYNIEIYSYNPNRDNFIRQDII